MNTSSFEELLCCLEANQGACDSIMKTYDPHDYVFGNAGYKSMIAVEGVPILPPVMTSRRAEEMRHHRSQAVITEMRVKARARRRLLQRVQKVVDSIEVSKASSTSEAALTNKFGSPEAAANILTGDSGISSRDQHSLVDNCIKEEALDTMAEVTDLSNEECEGTEEFSMDTGLVALMQDIIRPSSKNSTTSDSQQELCNTVISKQGGVQESSDTLEKVSADFENTAAEGGSATKSSPPRNSEVNDQRMDRTGANVSEDGEVEGMTSTLLSRVQLLGIGDETPSQSPVLADDSVEGDPQTVIKKVKGKDEESDVNESFISLRVREANMSPTHCQNEDIDKTELQSLPTPGPINTPDVSGIDFVQDDSAVNDISVTSKIVNEATGSPKVVESTKIEHAEMPHSDSQGSGEKQAAEISTCYTASTELGPYLASSAAMTTTSTTMPHVAEMTLESIHTSILDDGGKHVVEEGKLTDISDNSKEEDSSKSTSSSSRRRHVRHASYTLDHPSPVLVAMQANHVSTGPSTEEVNNTLISVEGGVRASTENLMTKPVQRKLEYDSEESYMSGKSDKPSTGPESKEEHLHTYLRNLSEMPVSSISAVRDETCHADRSTVSLLETMKRNKSAPQSYFGHLQPVAAAHSASPLEPGPSDSAYVQVTSASHGHKKSPSNVSTAAAGVVPPEEQALQMQIVYFEQLKQKLVEQQEQQLTVLLAQQQQQQHMLQQELLAQEQRLLQEVSFCAGTIPALEHSEEASTSGEKGYSDVAQSSVPGVLLKPEATVLPLGGNLSNSYFEDQNIEHRSLQKQLIHRPVISNVKPGEGLNHSKVHISPSSESVHGVSYRDFTQRTAPEIFSSSGHSAGSVSQQRLVSHTHLQLPNTYGKDMFARVTAAARGYLVRRLLRTTKVQSVIQTIKDTAIFALKFQQETPIKRGVYSTQDKKLQDSIISQLTAAMYEIHEIFFDISTQERMLIISQDRQLEQEKLFKTDPVPGKKVLSSATQKAMERKKKAMLAEASVSTKKVSRPNTAPASTSPKVFKSESSEVIKRQYQQIMKKSFRPIQARMSPAKPTKETSGKLSADRPKTAPGVMSSPKRVISKMERGKSPKRLTAKGKRLSIPAQTKPVRRSLYGGATSVVSTKKPKSVLTTRKDKKPS